MIALLINAWSHHGLHGRLQRTQQPPRPVASVPPVQVASGEHARTEAVRVRGRRAGPIFTACFVWL